MKVEKIELKYNLPDINPTINKKNEKIKDNPMEQLFNQFENIENNYINSQILLEISNSRVKMNHQRSNVMNSSLMIHNGIKCERCQKFPFIGHRYKCPRCLNYNLCEECEQLNSEIQFHPHKDFILIRIPESAEMNDGYSYECLTNNLEIHQNYGIDSFNYKIKLQNTGNQLWPEKHSILKCRKELSTIFCKNCELPPIDINETTEVNLIFDKCNKIPRGQYMAYLQFYIKGRIIRGPIKIKVFIE
jgi:hypothetical protein